MKATKHVIISELTLIVLRKYVDYPESIAVTDFVESL